MVAMMACVVLCLALFCRAEVDERAFIGVMIAKLQVVCLIWIVCVVVAAALVLQEPSLLMTLGTTEFQARPGTRCQGLWHSISAVSCTSALLGTLFASLGRRRVAQLPLVGPALVHALGPGVGCRRRACGHKLDGCARGTQVQREMTPASLDL